MSAKKPSRLRETKRRADLEEEFTSSLPLDALLPTLHAEDVLTDYEYKQLLPTPLTLVERNHRFLEYLGSTDPSALRRTLFILGRSKHQGHRYLGEILKKLFGLEGEEDGWMRGNANNVLQQGLQRSSRDKEVTAAGSNTDLIHRHPSYHKPVSKDTEYNGHDLQWMAGCKQKLESGLPLDALLPALHAENVLTDYEYKQLIPTPLTLVGRNQRFLQYLASKEPSVLRRTFLILGRPEYQEYQELREMLREFFGYEEEEEEEEEGMHLTENSLTQLENDHSSCNKETNAAESKSDLLQPPSPCQKLLVNMAPERSEHESVPQRKADLRRKLESSFPLDALLPALHAENVLTDHELEQLVPTPLTLLVRNRIFLDYLAVKDPVAIGCTLSILSRSELQECQYIMDMFKELFDYKADEGEGMHRKASAMESDCDILYSPSSPRGQSFEVATEDSECKPDIQQTLISGFPLDALLPTLHAENVLTDYEYKQLLPTPLTLEERNHRFLEYLSSKDPCALRCSLSVLSCPEHQEHQHYLKMLMGLYGSMEDEEGSMNRVSKEDSSGAKETSVAEFNSDLPIPHHMPSPKMAAEHSERESVPQRKADLRQKLESSFPLDALLLELRAENVLTDYEHEQLVPTPLTLSVRNRNFLDYLAGKDPSAISSTLSILGHPRHQEYQYLGELLKELYNYVEDEGEGMHGKASDVPQQDMESTNGDEEASVAGSVCDLKQPPSLQEQLLELDTRDSEFISDSRQKFISGFPLDAFLPTLHAENVLTDYEYNQLVPTPLTLVVRNRNFLDYLGSKEPSILRHTLSILSRSEHEEYQYFVEMLKELHDHEKDEEEGMGKHFGGTPQLGDEDSSSPKELSKQELLMPAPQRDRESPPATIHKVKDVSCTAHKSSVIKERTKSSLAPSDAFPLSWKCSPAGSECDYEVASLSGSMSTFHTLVMPSPSPQPTSVSPSLTVQQTTDNNVSGRKQETLKLEQNKYLQTQDDQSIKQQIVMQQQQTLQGQQLLQGQQMTNAEKMEQETIQKQQVSQSSNLPDLAEGQCAGVGAAQPMSPWNIDALVSLQGDLKLKVLMSTGLSDKLQIAAGGFLNAAEAQQVSKQHGNDEQIAKLIEILKGKQDKDFITFLSMLQDTNNEVWAKELEKRAEKFKRENIDGRGSDGVLTSSTSNKGSLRTKLGCYYCKECIQDNPLLVSSTMNYVLVKLVQPEQRKPIAGKVGEAVTVHLVRGGVEQVPHVKMTLNYEDILSFSPPTGINRKRVLVEGLPGIGKSTLVQRICHDWSVGHLAQDYTVVIQVNLRSLPKDQPLILEDLVFTSVEDKDVAEEILRFVTYHKGREVLFIFDGFDEMPEKMQKNSLVRSILDGRFAPQSSFVVTTRPISAASLYHCVDRRVEICGFTEEGVKHFVTEYFALSNPSMGEKLLSTLYFRPQLKRLCYVPFQLLLICYTASLGGDSSEIPRTLHELVESLIILTINHNLERGSQNKCAGSIEDVSHLCSGFDELTHLALQGIEKDIIIFPDLNFEMDSAFHGLFNCIKTRNRFGVISRTWHFLHLILQEFMAAVAVANKTPEEQVVFWRQHLIMKYNKTGSFILADDRYQTIFLLYCGVSRLNNPGIQGMLLEALNTGLKPGFNLDSPLPELCEFVAESGNEQVALSILTPCGPMLEIDRSYLNDSVVWCISLYCKQMDGAGIRIDGENTQDIANCISRLEDVSTLTTVMINKRLHFMLNESESTKRRMSDLQTIKQFLLKQANLKYLGLCICVGIESPVFQYPVELNDIMKDVLTYHKDSLEELALGIPNGMFNALWKIPCDPCVELLVTCQKLTSLELISTNLSPQSLLAVLKQLHNLRALELKEMAFPDIRFIHPSTVDLIASSVENHPSLRELVVEACHINLLVKGVVEGMAKRHGVEKLFVYVPVPAFTSYPDFIKPISAVMRTGSLKSMWVGEIMSLQAERIFKELTYCTHLRELKLDLQITGTFPVCLSKCTTLQKLTVRLSSQSSSASSVTSALLQATILSQSLELVSLWECVFDGCDQAVKTFASCLKNSRIQKLELIECAELSPIHIATICKDLHDNEILEELIITSTKGKGAAVSDPLVLQSVVAAIRANRVLKRIVVFGSALEWTSVATAILKGAAENKSKSLRNLELVTPKYVPPPQETVNEVRRVNPKLRLVVMAGGVERMRLGIDPYL